MYMYIYLTHTNSLSLSLPYLSLPLSLSPSPSEMMFSWSLVLLQWVPRPCVSHLTSLNQSNRARPVSIRRVRIRPSFTPSLEGATDCIFCGGKESKLN